MTKRNLLLVSLFLVFGLVATATSALATAWTVNGNEYFDGRAEGLAEATGQVVLSLNAGGTITPQNNTQMGFKFTYSAPVIAGTAGVVCTTNTGTVWAGGCGTTLVSPPTIVGDVVYIYFATNISPGYSFATGDGSQMTLTVRVNATGLAGHSVTCSVQAIAPGASSQVSLVGGNPQSAGTVLYVNPLPSLSLTFGTTETSSEGRPRVSKAGNILSCIGVEDVSTYDNRFCVNVDEAFPNALTSESYEIGLDPGSGTGDVTNGTTFTLTFPNVPTGIYLKWESLTPCWDLNVSDPNYCAGGSLMVSDPGSATITANVGSNPPTNTVSYTFTVTGEDAGFAENMNICFKFYSHAQLPPGYSPVTAQVAMGPSTPASDIPVFTGNVEATTPSPFDVILISDCQTILLFPYVADDYAYDTGISVSNTTMDPFNTGAWASYLGKGSAKPQTGPCTFFVYSSGTQVTFPTPSIIPGSTFSFFLSVPAPDVNGYAIAICDFQNAHGQATIQFGLGFNYGVETGYLADVLPDPQWYPRSPAGTGLGETAVAPYLLSRDLIKELNGFHE